MEQIRIDSNDGTTVAITGTGVQQHAESPRLQRMMQTGDKAIAYAMKSQTHLWVATTAFALSDEAIANAGDEPLMLDLENMLFAPMLGCFVCEQPYSERLRHRKCKGQPS